MYDEDEELSPTTRGYIQMGKDWLCATKLNGFGLKKGAFLSYVNHRRKQHSNGNSFYIYSSDIADSCDIHLNTLRKYANEFAARGYYDLTKIVNKQTPNIFNYTPNGSFPWTNDFWNVPNVLIKPVRMGGMGLAHGMVFFWLLDKSILTKSETFKISCRELSRIFGFNLRMPQQILNTLNKTNLVVIDGNTCSIRVEETLLYLKIIQNFWEKANSKEWKREQVEAFFWRFTRKSVNHVLLPLLEAE